MGLRLDHPNDTERLDAWARIIKRIYDEQVEHAWGLRLLRAVLTTNPRLSAEGGFIFEWMVRNYVDANLMLLRRELDIQSNTESLRNLLLDICEHPTVIQHDPAVRAALGRGSRRRRAGNRPGVAAALMQAVPLSLDECLGLSRRRTGGKSHSRSPMAATLRLHR